ncbi:DNA repair protein complementing XP-C cells homolog isoform X3 [Belonocnema kinseyi]|nr:DNA repair protein complementing XP-C cells homolog isoform X2 [Belonocnema kinseyi]XP_033216215.1 DNA repair protein complementing XP-C cells homolog isoform X3 [Belonocnema kinseyi]
MSDSDDESSGSSDDFLVPADKINLSSSFFDEKLNSHSNLKTAPNTGHSSESDEDDAENVNVEDIDNTQAAELFSQILKNLQRQKGLENLRQEQSIAKHGTKDVAQGESSKSRGLANEIDQLLLQGESEMASTSFENNGEHEKKEESKLEISKYEIPKEGVQITLAGETKRMILERKKKKTDLETLLKNKLNQRIRTTQVLVHKVGLLWWLVYGFHLNRLANDPEVLATCLSLISKNDYPKGRVDLVYLQRVTVWFKKTFPMDPNRRQVILTTESLLERIRERKICDYRALVLLYVALLRAIGLNCRLVVSLSPPHLKPKREQLFQAKKEEEELKTEAKEEKSKYQKKKSTAKRNSKKKEKTEDPLKVIAQNSQDGRKKAQMEARKKAASILKKGKSGEKSESEIMEDIKLNSDSKSKSTPQSQAKQSSRVAPEKGKSNKEESKLRKTISKLPVCESLTSPGIINEENSDEDIVLRKFTTRVKTVHVLKKDRKLISVLDEGETGGGKITALENKKLNKQESEEKLTIETKLRKRVARPPVHKPLTIAEFDDEDDSDEDFVYRKPSKRAKNEKVFKKDRKLISDSDESETGKKKNPEDIWVEVYVESEKSWICVSVTNAKIHCVNEIYKKISDPVLYIVAYNPGGTVKDVTRRYCPNWLTVTRKQRVDENWWRDALKPWKEKKTSISEAEDKMLLQRELEQPLPKTVSECKGHPLYALVRHLLKFEALYPPDVVPLGYLKNGEAIYSRYCVHILRSRETWVKHARVVKPAQEAYKVVKSMPKYDKFSGTKTKGLPLELFGKWQTTQYIPPEAKDGIVPRNEYGNVDLFQMCMLPKGTAYIDLPGLSRIARKLNIDCSPAVVGFNFGGMGAVPAFQGFVVCTEFEDTLREAWEAEQIEASKRAREKRDKRIYGNWKKLIRGLLIRERLAARYTAPDAGYSDQEEPVKPVLRKQISSKERNKKIAKESVDKDLEEDEKPAKKAKVTQIGAPPKKDPTKKDKKSKVKKNSGEAATTSSKVKQALTAKKSHEEEDSDADFEPKKTKRETRSQRNKIS